MRVWNLDDVDDDESDIQVYVLGPPGPGIVDVGSFLHPVIISSSIAAPANRRQRSFIQASSPANQPAIPNPTDNSPWEIYLYVVGGSTITLNNASNLKLSGEWIGHPDSILYLQWDGNSRYVEGGRNEI